MAAVQRLAAPLALAAFLAGIALLIATLPRRSAGGSDQAGFLRGVSGPIEKTVISPERPASLNAYSRGSSSRLAVLLTDPHSGWLGIAHGLKAIGVPFLITRDYRAALRHRVVLVYPVISGKVLSIGALRALAALPRRGGVLIGVNVLGGLNEVFGFDHAVESRSRLRLLFTCGQRRPCTFRGPRETSINLGSPTHPQGVLTSVGYTHPRAAPLARFDDGTAGITARAYGAGKVYAFGIDIGQLLLQGYNNRSQGIERSYVNGYEPTLDLFLRLLKDMYADGNASAVTLSPTPAGKALSVLLTHDLDSRRSFPNALAFAEFERKQRLPATYFIQTKYVRDWNDVAFLTAGNVAVLKRLARLGMELGSHTVSHSRQFNGFPLGGGDETFPAYQPLVKDATTTVHGTILGELRVSRFLLQHLSGEHIISFRPGYLRDPFDLPQALAATGYQFGSSVTANDSLTHLPFQLDYARGSVGETNVFEFPVTVEDQAPPFLLARLPHAIGLARAVARYNGLFVVLIHPNVVGYKLEFERRLVRALRPFAWFGTLADYGRWWRSRNAVGVDVQQQAAGSLVRLTIPSPLHGLTLSVPAGLRLAAVNPRSVRASQSNTVIVIGRAGGSVTLRLVPG